MFRRMYSMPALLLLVFALSGTQVAVADGASGNKLVGSWTVKIEPEPFFGIPDAFDVTVINKDGTMSNSDSILGTGHGIWERLAPDEDFGIGPRTFRMKFMTPILEGNSLGLPGGLFLTVTAMVTLDKSGNTATGPFQTTVGAPGGPAGPGFFGKVTFTRIMFND